MIGPSLFPKSGSGGPAYDDTSVKQRLDAAEGDIGALKSGKATTASVTAVRDRVEAVENGRATVASVTAVSDRVTTLEQSGGSGGGGGSSGPSVPFLIGVHEIMSGASFNKSAFLAAPFMVGVNVKHCRVEMYLVGGGAAGWSRSSSSSSFQSPGGRQGSVRIVRGLSIDDLVDGTPLAVGAGGLNRVGNTGLNGGDTTFGSSRARGGIWNITNEILEDTSDERLGRPGSTGILNTPGTVSSQDGANARVSLGPGAGGGATGTLWGLGGPSNPDDARRARSTPFANGAAGQSADAGTLAYGSGGAGGNGANGGNGGFPGGGGGSTCGGTELPAGNGGNGVIRLAVYQYRVPA